MNPLRPTNKPQTQTKVPQHTSSKENASQGILEPSNDVKTLTPTVKANDSSTKPQSTETKPVKYIEPDMTVFDYVDVDKGQRSYKAGILSDKCVNMISATLKTFAPTKPSATDIAKLAGAAKILYDLEMEMDRVDGPNVDKVRDITSQMGVILRSRKGHNRGSTS